MKKPSQMTETALIGAKVDKGAPVYNRRASGLIGQVRQWLWKSGTITRLFFSLQRCRSISVDPRCIFLQPVRLPPQLHHNIEIQVT